MVFFTSFWLCGKSWSCWLSAVLPAGKGALTIPSPCTAAESHSLFLNTLIIEGWNNLLRSELDPACTFDGMITHTACTASQRYFEINLIEVTSQVLGVFWRQTPQAVASHFFSAQSTGSVSRLWGSCSQSTEMINCEQQKPSQEPGDEENLRSLRHEELLKQKHEIALGYIISSQKAQRGQVPVNHWR